MISKIICCLLENVSISPEFIRYKKALYIYEGVLLYQDRVVVLNRLRPHVLKNLHAAREGVSSMEQRAQAYMFWPEITYDTHTTRSKCSDCNRDAPFKPSFVLNQLTNHQHLLKRCLLTSLYVQHITILWLVIVSLDGQRYLPPLRGL